MRSNDPNVGMVEIIANALGSLTEQLVFVGGCAIGLLVSDEGGTPVRATQDVDLIAEVTSHVEYYALADKLRALGFKEHVGDVNCRWRFKDVLVDVMPTDEKILGYSNRWYKEALQHASLVRLPSGRQIRLVPSPLLIATKLEAFYGRGHGDYGASHDLEDIINLIDGRPELIDEVEHCDGELHEYLREEIDGLLAEESFIEAISWHLPPDSTSQARVTVIVERLRRIAGI